MIKILLRFTGLAALVYLSVLGGLYLNQRNMIYIPSLQEKAKISDVKIPGAQEIVVTTKDGLSIYGWYVPAQKGKPTIVRFHGNGSNVVWNMNALQPYIEKGYGALAAEYRGYSGNPGKPTEEGLYNDARAFLEWLHAQGVKNSNIILYGESIGSGPAVQMALEYPDVHTLVLQCPLKSLYEAAEIHYSYLPVRWLLKDRFDNFSKIGKIKMPLIVAHGTVDTVIPYERGKSLYEAAPEPKTLITIEGGNHNDLDKFGLDEKILSAISE